MTTEADILVVGAGIMGVASAYHLKKNNPAKRVLLVDRYGAAGQGNTGRSNAMFRNTFSSADNQVLSDAAIDFYLDAEREEGIGLQQVGYLWLMSEAGLASSEPYLRSMADNGVEVKRFSKSELKDKLPDIVTEFDGNPEAGLMGLEPVEWGLFGPKCGALDPDKLVRFYLRRFQELGGEAAFNVGASRLILAPLERLGLDGEPLVWQDAKVEGVVTTGGPAGEIRADTVVLACGAWENQLLEPAGMDGHVKAKKRQLFSVYAQDQRLAGLLRTKGFNELGLVPMVILPKSGVYFRPVSSEESFWVGCEDNLNRAYEDTPRELAEYEAEASYFDNGIHPVLRSYFPCFAKSKPRSMWAGLYAYNTADYLPFVFREGNLIAVGGDSGSGIMKGDSLGRIVDAVYRGEDEAMLYGDVPYKVDRIGFRNRAVAREEWIL